MADGGGNPHRAAALLNLTARAAEWAKNSRERRQLHAMATLTPDHLFARCGAAVRDDIKVVVSGLDADRNLSAQGQRKAGDFL